MGTPWLSIIRMTVCQPLGVYPAPTRADNAWQLLQLAATSSLPFPSGNSSPHEGSARHRAAAIGTRLNLSSIAISP